MTNTQAQDIKQNLKKISGQMEAAAVSSGRDPGSVRLVAVTKTVPASRVAMAVEAGAVILGESYIQEAQEKIRSLPGLAASWHFIGRLQSNKARFAVELFDLIHSVDSAKLAREIDRRAASIGKVQDVLIQVNIGLERTKAGVLPEAALDLAGEIGAMENVRVKGLMGMAPFFDAPQKARPFFARLAQISERIREKAIPEVQMRELSMGMTGDFEAAVAEGATLVRIGTAIFGSRT